MEYSLFSAVLIALLLLLVGYASLVFLFTPKYDPREPPVLTHYVPYVGHVLGLIFEGQGYFERLR